jgi:hypothetical protein
LREIFKKLNNLNRIFRLQSIQNNQIFNICKIKFIMLIKKKVSVKYRFRFHFRSDPCIERETECE